MLRLAVTLLVISISIASPAKQPNVVFLLVDDVGYNDVSWHNPYVQTPNLERLARDGLILENHYVLSNCGPSRNALMTGHYPILTGGQFLSIRTMEPIGIPTKFKLMPQFLKDLGYSTHAIGKWHLGYCNPDYLPSNRGFDTHRGFWNGGGEVFDHTLTSDPYDPNSAGYDFHMNEEIDFSAVGDSTSKIIGDRVHEILAEHVSGNDTNPFFIYAAFQDSHRPLEVEEEYSGLYPEEKDPKRKAFLGMMTRLDAAVGQIVSDLESIEYTNKEDGEVRTMLDDTVIIFSSDNGGTQDFIYSGGSNLPLRGGKLSSFEGGSRVPAFVWNSGRKGITEDFLHITDWLPTIYSGLAGGDPADLPESLSGFNQIDLISNAEGSTLREEVLYDIANMENTNVTWQWGPNAPADLDFSGIFAAALRYKDWKIILGCNTISGCANNFGEVQDPDDVLMFNLAEDPNETTDLANDPLYADILEDLRERVQYHYDRAVQPFRAEENREAGSPSNMDPQVFFTGWCESIIDPSLK